MADSDHVEILRNGTTAWGSWRGNYPNLEPDLSGIDFTKPPFDRINLSNCNFNKCNLSGAKLMMHELSGASFHLANLGGADFSGANLSEVNLNGAHAVAAVFSHAKMQDAKINDALLTKAQLRGSNLAGSKIANTNMDAADLTEANLAGAQIQKVSCIGAQLVGVNLGPRNEVNPSGTCSKLRYSNLNSANLQLSRLPTADLSGTLLEMADLRSASMNASTKFTDCPPPHGMKIDRYALEMLGDDYGGFSRGHRMVMDIHDDVAFLRQRFSGVFRIVHLIALIAFLFPYVWFLGLRWWDAHFKTVQEDSITILVALLRFIVSGGSSWQEGWNWSWSFSLFVIAVVYNVMRSILMGKTLHLEMKEEITGLPQRFSLVGKWGAAYWVMKYSLLLYLIAVLFNTIRFLWMPVPIG